MGSPLSQQIMAALQQRSTSGGAAPGGGGQAIGMSGGGGEDTGNAYAQQVSDLKGADPGQLVAQLKKIKQVFAVMLVQNLERLPNVSGKISKLIPAIDQVIKEAQQASSVNAAVRNPIAMGAAQPQPGTEGGNASPGMF